MWMLYVEGKNVPSKIHESWTSAEVEAERLARLNPGNKVIIFGIVREATVKLPEVTWTERRFS